MGDSRIELQAPVFGVGMGDTRGTLLAESFR